MKVATMKVADTLALLRQNATAAMAVILDHELHASRSTNMPLAVTYMMAAEIAERAWTMAEAMLDNEPSARKVAVLLECQRNAQAERDQ